MPNGVLGPRDTSEQKQTQTLYVGSLDPAMGAGTKWTGIKITNINVKLQLR